MSSLSQFLSSHFVTIVITMSCIMGFLTFNALFLVWAERKVSARIQRRLGPTEVGPAGLLQTTADMIKLISKQLITPTHVNRSLYFLAPVLIFAPIPALISLIPYSPTRAFANLDISLVVLLAFAGLSVISVFAAGWGSNNKYALLGAMRAIAQGLSYEIPMLLAVLAIVMLTRSLNLMEIANAQSRVWFVLIQPLAAIIYFISAVAETNRAPFDIPEAESELVAGFHTEYSGMRFAMFFFAEYSNMALVSAIAATLFLGGAHGPLLPGVAWLMIKIYALVFVMMWIRWTFPRLRFDQLMRFSWMILVPLAVLNLLATALLMKLF